MAVGQLRNIIGHLAKFCSVSAAVTAADILRHQNQPVLPVKRRICINRKILRIAAEQLLIIDDRNHGR